MPEKKWCNTCRFLMPFSKGVCLVCTPELPSEKELEESGQQTMFDIPEPDEAA